MKNIGFVSLGCPKNQADLELLAGTLEGRFNFVSDPSQCDLMIINTCGFIEEAVREAIDTILSMRGQMPEHAKLVVFGCMSERYKGDLAKELPEIDFFAGVGSQKEVSEYINSVFPDGRLHYDGTKRYLFNAPYYAYLKISEGCSNRCTYCTIPSIRGGHRSFRVDDIMADARRLVDGGAKELIIISQDSTKYGTDLDGNIRLHNLAEMLAESFPSTYIRLMYLNPDGVTPELIDTVKKYKNIVKYFEIPVQHASERMLKRMNRHSTADGIQQLYRTIRREVPEAVIRTTLIVGFPGETEEDFQAAARFIEEAKPDFAGFFSYSPEDGTPAAAFSEQVDAKTVAKRIKTLQKLQKKNTSDRMKAMKQNEIICFAERPNDDFEFIVEGRALFQAPDVDGKLYVIDGEASDGYGPYRAKIKKIAYPDIYVEITGVAE